MKVGDLVKHVDSDIYGIVVELIPTILSKECDLMAAIEWANNDSYGNDWLYQSSKLEVLSEA